MPSPASEKVFVDTSAFYALIDADDENHSTCVEAWRALADEEPVLVTHNLVVVESIALVQARMGVAAIEDLVPFVETTQVAWVGREEHDLVLAAVLARGRRDVSFVDHASFLVMRRDGVVRALAFDRHFADEGFALAV